MKGSILIGIMLASILLMLSFGVTLAAKENMTMSVNESMSVNITPDNMPLSVIMIPQDNMTAVSDNKTMTMIDNKFIVLQNVTVNIITIMPPNMINT